jgi:hypothetical protein
MIKPNNWDINVVLSVRLDLYKNVDNCRNLNLYLDESWDCFFKIDKNDEGTIVSPDFSRKLYKKVSFPVRGFRLFMRVKRIGDDNRPLNYGDLVKEMGNSPLLYVNFIT